MSDKFITVIYLSLDNRVQIMQRMTNVYVVIVEKVLYRMQI